MINEIVAVGHIGTGITRLEQLLVGLPKTFLTPVVIVARAPGLTAPELHARLQAQSQLPVVEVDDKDPIAPGRVYLAPPDYHLLIEREGRHFALAADAPSTKPSIDRFFDSVAQVYGTRTVALLTRSDASAVGSSDEVAHDGTQGLEKIKKAGGMVVTEIADLLTESMPTNAAAVPHE